MATSSGMERRGSPVGKAASVRVAGIRKTYRDAPALDGIDLAIPAGELIALLGPSGSGKTTLLRVVAGLEIPDEGRVFFGDAEVTDLPVQDRGIGFVFQHYALFRHLTVFDNVAYGLRARRRGRPPAAVLHRRVLDLLDLVQLVGLDRRFPAQLSGGQRQRVALARALATEPHVLLLDEPFGALDARVRKDLRRWLKDIHRETGQTTVFVTHDQEEALELADRVAVINRGALEQVGTPDEIHDDPASAFVMSFIGESARLPVRIEGGVAIFGGRALSIPASGQPDGECDIFVRPADLVLSDPAVGEVAGKVLGTRRVAGGRRADIRLEPGGLEVEIDLRDRQPAPGERVSLSVAAGRFFGRERP